MKAYQERVVAERNELYERGDRLSAFINSTSTTYRELPLMEKERLRLQFYLMEKLIEVLDDRIAYFKEI